MNQLMNALRRKAEALYHTLPYHNWQHAQEVWANAQALMARYAHTDLAFDPLIVECECLLHDISGALDTSDVYVPRGTRTKGVHAREDYQAFWAGTVMHRLGFSDSYCTAVARGIRTTHPDVLPTEPHEIVLAAADVSPVGYGSYRSFVEGGNLLAKEAAILSGKTIDTKLGIRFGMSYLGLFTARRLSLGNYYHTPEGQSAWHLGAMHNIIRRCREAGLAEKVVVDLHSNGVPAGSVGTEVNMTGDVTHISIGPKWKQRRRAMQQLTRHAAQQGALPPVLIAVPNEPTRLSIPNHVADGLYVSTSELLRLKRLGIFNPSELNRVLKKAGTVTLYETQGARPTTPFVETYGFDTMTAWLKSAGLTLGDTHPTEYGYAAIYT